MITQAQLYTAIQALFPSYTIFEDIGEYAEAYRVVGTNALTFPICGMFQVSPFNYVASQGLKITTVAATLEFLPTPQQMPGVRDTINGVAAVNSNQTVIMIDSDNTSYTVTTWYSSAQVGNEQSSPSNTGRVIPVMMYAQYTMFENGINGNDITLKIDGKTIYYTEINMARVRAMDAVPKLSGISDAKILNTNASLSFNAPLLTTDGSGILQAATYGPETNKAHCVEIKIKATTYYYIMTFGNCVNTSAPGLNAGIQINLHETSPEEVETWGATWGIYKTNKTITYLNIYAPSVVFWGDGTTSYATTYTGHTYTDGQVEHTIVTYGSSPLVWRLLRVGDNLYGHKLKYGGATTILNDEGETAYIICSDGGKFMLDTWGVWREYDLEGSYFTVEDGTDFNPGTEWTSGLNVVSYIDPMYAGDFFVRIDEMGL